VAGEVSGEIEVRIDPDRQVRGHVDACVHGRRRGSQAEVVLEGVREQGVQAGLQELSLRLGPPLPGLLFCAQVRVQVVAPGPADPAAQDVVLHDPRALPADQRDPLGLRVRTHHGVVQDDIGACALAPIRDDLGGLRMKAVVEHRNMGCVAQGQGKAPARDHIPGDQDLVRIRVHGYGRGQIARTLHRIGQDPALPRARHVDRGPLRLAERVPLHHGPASSGKDAVPIPDIGHCVGLDDRIGSTHVDARISRVVRDLAVPDPASGRVDPRGAHDSARAGPGPRVTADGQPVQRHIAARAVRQADGHPPAGIGNPALQASRVPGPEVHGPFRLARPLRKVELARLVQDVGVVQDGVLVRGRARADQVVGQRLGEQQSPIGLPGPGDLHGQDRVVRLMGSDSQPRALPVVILLGSVRAVPQGQVLPPVVGVLEPGVFPRVLQDRERLAGFLARLQPVVGLPQHQVVQGPDRRIAEDRPVDVRVVRIRDPADRQPGLVGPALGPSGDGVRAVQDDLLARVRLDQDPLVSGPVDRDLDGLAIHAHPDQGHIPRDEGAGRLADGPPRPQCSPGPQVVPIRCADVVHCGLCVRTAPDQAQQHGRSHSHGSCAGPYRSIGNSRHDSHPQHLAPRAARIGQTMAPACPAHAGRPS